MKSWFAILIFLMIPIGMSAHMRHGGPRGDRFFVPHWHEGYWFHGRYAGHAGWWWVIGPNWYYYPAPSYPYPPEGGQGVYVVQVPNASAPPPAATPGAASPPAEKNTLPSATNANERTAFTYYCEKTKAYYPTAATCADGWVATPVKGPN